MPPLTFPSTSCDGPLPSVGHGLLVFIPKYFSSSNRVYPSCLFACREDEELRRRGIQWRRRRWCVFVATCTVPVVVVWPCSCIRFQQGYSTAVAAALALSATAITAAGHLRPPPNRPALVEQTQTDAGRHGGLPASSPVSLSTYATAGRTGGV